jgi:hypothetical protein
LATGEHSATFAIARPSWTASSINAFTGHVGVATASLDKRRRVDGEYAIAN